MIGKFYKCRKTYTVANNFLLLTRILARGEVEVESPERLV